MKRSRAAGTAWIVAANPSVPITCRLFIAPSPRLTLLEHMQAERSRHSAKTA